MRTNTEHMRKFAQNISAFEMNDRPFLFFFSSMLPLRFTPQAVQYEKNKRIFSMMILCLLVYLQDTCAFSSGASLGSVSGFSRRHASFSRRHASFRCLRSYRHLVPLHVLMADWQQATDTATGKIYYWNQLTGETAWTMPDGNDAQQQPSETSGADELPLQFTGQGTKAKVLYKEILRDAFTAVQAARAAGKRRLQIEFPLDEKDEGKTLVKRFELLSTWAEELATKFGLPRTQRVGENIETTACGPYLRNAEIRDNVTPGGGGEYLTNEGIYGYRLSSVDNSEQVLLVLVAGVDTERLEDLEALLNGARQVGRRLPGGMQLDVASTGVLSSLDTVGYVEDMSVREDATIVLINSGLDKVVAGGGGGGVAGMFGLGGGGAGVRFLKSFEPCYYIKRASTGFLEFHFRSSTWRLWGVPRDATELRFQIVSFSQARPALWESERTIKSLCRS